MLKTLLVTTISFAAVTSAYAVAVEVGPRLVAPTGKVLVNQGQGFVAASDGLALNFKDQIMVGKDAAVTLAYARCSVVLKQGTILTLPKGDLCGKEASATLTSSNALRVEPAASVAQHCTDIGSSNCTAVTNAQLVADTQLVALGFGVGMGIMIVGSSLNNCKNSVSAC